ncbi:tetratricopeptide repeat protein [Brachyspira aalborgi]|uniref:Tetratricopeptide repeat protein n=1 Tax=Brachyspira aalborgi TaxID=29522 RepID=A0A5C8G5A3_9SPIR|nr:tetratricopeptide repeat protein [Brachyspira aalborgi]TXJ56698.1 tetratricopeptide repeat protein [Brachyspira aalborgi]
MENLTNEEKDYYELLVDLLENGEISDSERNILNKRKEKYSISDSRASEIEEFAKQERLQNLKPQNDSENSYYELILDFVENGIVSESNRKILNKRLEKYGITDARAKELEYFAKQEYLESKKVKFESEEEKEYYEFIVDLIENGAISENSRKILDKRKIKFGISETRAKELEEFAKQNNSASSNDLLEEGKTYYNNGEYDKAIEIFKKAVELNPNEYLNWQWLGRSYYERYSDGDEENALNSLLKAVELNPNNDSNWYWLGISYGMNSQYDKEKESFLKATELNPNNADNWYKLGISYFNDKQYDKAIESFSKAVELNPNDDNNWDRLANSYQMNGQYDKAIETLLKAIEIDPNSRYYWFNLGILYYYNERYREAIDSLSKALELLNIEEEEDKEDFWDTDSSADYRYWLGRSYYMNEQCQEAINYLSKAVELNPDDYFNWYFLGSSYLDLKDYDNAVYSFNQCIKIDPNNEVVRDILQILQSSNEGVSLDGVVSGISKGIDTLNELSGKINPSTIGMVVGAAKLVGKFFGGSNKDKN